MKYELLKKLIEEDSKQYNLQNQYLCVMSHEGVIPHKIQKFNEEVIELEIPFSATLNNKMKVDEILIQVLELDKISQFVKIPAFLAKIIKQKESKIITLDDQIVRPN